ncbi:DUF6114 domain-containing protein [Streptomyces sp. YIM S03343]
MTRFRQWRGGRPFVGGVLLTVGGAEILVTMKAPLGVLLHIGMQGVAGLLLPVLMMVCGLLVLFNPAQRLFYSILGILLSLGTWVTSNLGGFFIGLLLGATGSCMAFGWLPDQEPRIGRRQRRKAAAREAALREGQGAEEAAGTAETGDAGEAFASAVPSTAEAG